MGQKSPFGSVSRLQSLRQHYGSTGTYRVDTAWEFVYRELLWIDKSNGLAHLYESDKAQVGRSHWYERTVSEVDPIV